jgi:predicted nucleic acid-binding protein
MALIADSGGVYGLYDAKDRNHAALETTFDRERGPVVVSAAILGEIDYLLRARLSPPAALHFLTDLHQGVFALEPFTAFDLTRCRIILEQYHDLHLGLCDAAVMATAERLGTDRILTVDERHFRAVCTAKGLPFTLLPADEPSR